MWFAGSKMHAQSRLLQRVYTAGMKRIEPVLLWVRKEGEGYCLLGKLHCVAADLQATPIAIKWQLLDYDALMTNSVFFRTLVNS